MTDEQFQLLKEHLAAEYVPHLPPLLQPHADPEENTRKDISRAYAAFVIHQLAGIPPAAACQTVVDDFDDNGLDAIHYFEARKELLIVQGKLKGNESFKRAEALALAKGVEDLVNQRYDRFNDNVVNRQADLEYALRNADKIAVVVAHSSSVVSDNAKTVIEEFLGNPNQRDNRVSTDWTDYGPEETVNDFLGHHAVQPISEQLHFTGQVEVQDPRRTLYGQIELQELVDLYANYGNRLFEKNIRFFLGTTASEVNQAIHQTLQQRPEDFFYLSNGVTAVANEITQREVNEDKVRYEVSGLSIVNGAQTVASSHQYCTQNVETDISQARVLFTVIQVEDGGEFELDVTKSRNHQNKVTASHFAALDENQERLRCELAFSNIIYRYRPDSDPPGAGVDSIFIEDAAAALASIDPFPGSCVTLKISPSRFTNPDAPEYVRIFTNELSGIRLANATQLYLAAKAKVDAYESSSSGLEKMIYRHGRHALIWLVLSANVDLLDRQDVMDMNDADNHLSAAMDLWRQKFFDESTNELNAANIGPLAFFKSLTNTQPFVIRLRDEGV